LLLQNYFPVSNLDVYIYKMLPNDTDLTVFRERADQGITLLLLTVTTITILLKMILRIYEKHP
jgi:ABC-type phosphate transport system permease subunit